MSGSAGSSSPVASMVPAVARAIAPRPWLWATALGTVWRLAEPGWWRRAPHLPLPNEQLWSFRMVTAYGGASAQPGSEDIVAYLEWCRSAHGRRFGARLR
ncbi:MAG TPA: hypothetical protein VHZ02_08605 [Acidimicrobiales bacterium]|nr:hypothetical protein [Acidimicrobiales bacterium]